MTGFSADRTFRGSLLTSGPTKKLIEFGVYFFAPCDQFLHARDLAFNVQHAPPPLCDEYISYPRAIVTGRGGALCATREAGDERWQVDHFLFRAEQYKYPLYPQKRT